MKEKVIEKRKVKVVTDLLNFIENLESVIKEQQKEIEERKKGYLLENKLFTETLKKQCREIDELKKKNKNLMEETLDKLEKMFPLDNDLKFYGYRNEIEEFKSKLKKNKTNSDLPDYQSGEI